MKLSPEMLLRRQRFDRQRRVVLYVLSSVGVALTLLFIALPGPLPPILFGALVFQWWSIWLNLAIYMANRQRNALYDAATGRNSAVSLNLLGHVSTGQHALFCALLLDPRILYRKVAEKLYGIDPLEWPDDQ
jgi:hypothetical protein